MENTKNKKSNTKHVIRTILLVMLPIAIVSAILLLFSVYKQYYFTVDFTPSSYEETADALDNPYQGWYRLYGYQLSDVGAPDTQALQKQVKESSENRLVLLEINLNEYKDRELSAQALSMLESILSTWKNSSCQMILRFLYDWSGNAAQYEPQSVEQIRQHIISCAEVVNRFADDIYMLQGIFVGNYGEMHGSIHLNENDIRTLAKDLVAAIDPSIFLAVRTPQHWRMIAERFTPITEENAFLNTPAARFGIFNDGMLGSETDLNSYNSGEDPVLSDASAAKDYSQKGSREEELDFQDALCAYVPNGGEVVIDNPCNDLENAIQVLAKTHVSYLNCGYDLAVLEKWKHSVYQGKNDDCFNGMDGYHYISRHLGYRYAVAEAKLSLPDGSFQFHPATLQLTVRNSGFSSCYRTFQAEITVKNEDSGNTQSIPVHTDTRLWKSASSAEITVPLDIKRLGCGNYTVYFKLTDPSSQTQIQLANRMKQDNQYGYETARLQIKK